MSEPVEIHRKEVEQRILIASTQGGWEGTHTDFKKELGLAPQNFAKLLKHILAFANTPRRTDAYIIFGVEEDKNLKKFRHVGLSGGMFPSPETLYSLIRHYTNLSDIFVDAYFELDRKLTPYVMIPLQNEGPHRLLHAFQGAPDVLAPGEIACRYGSSSIRATDRDVFRMESDWDRWILDCRYEKTAKSLMELLTKRFPNHTVLEDKGSYVRMIYDSAISDEFGSSVAPILVHAYSGFDSVEQEAVQRAADDNIHSTFGKTLIGARFSLAARGAAAAVGVRCIPLDEIYFVNDSYAKLCRAFLQRWDDERSSRNLNFIIDLDYKLSAGSETFNRSILTFLETQLATSERKAILVHGDFGGGKTTTAKQLVAELCTDYLRGNTDSPKVIYVNVNNIDIRARRDECIEAELAKYRLSHDCIDDLIAKVRDDEIHLVFDGVDEMARPYTAGGRKEAMELLRDIGNRRAAIYLVRSSYFPRLTEMIASIATVADHDFERAERRTVVAKIVRLRQEQVNSYLDATLGSEDAKAVRSSLKEAKLDSFLEDPLIISLVVQVVEAHGKESLGILPRKGERARFLSHLVHQLLTREQNKRTRHRGLDFEQFQRILNNVAFSMVCKGYTSVTHQQLEGFISRGVGQSPNLGETVDAFRTMSWIHRSDDGTLSFRHDALTIVCAAQHICEALEHRDVLALGDWQSAAPLASVICDCAAEIMGSSALLAATSLQGVDLQFNVLTLVTKVLESARGRDFPPLPDMRRWEVKELAGICRGIATAPSLSLKSIELLAKSLSDKKVRQLTLPLLWLLARKDSPGAVAAALATLGSRIRPKFDLHDELSMVKGDVTSFVDAMLLKELRISPQDVLDIAQYEPLFRKMASDTAIDGHATQYADRTLKSIDGEKQRRETLFKKHSDK